MKNPTLQLSTQDHHVLTHLLSGLSTKNEALIRLRGELVSAVVLDASVVPPTAVGLNSAVRLLDLDTNEEEEYVLTMPAAADPASQRISVLAPVGAALIGYQAGDEIEWPTPGGLRHLKILSVTRDSDGFVKSNTTA